jgi:hypothetical protein
MNIAREWIFSRQTGFQWNLSLPSATDVQFDQPQRKRHHRWSCAAIRIAFKD